MKTSARSKGIRTTGSQHLLMWLLCLICALLVTGCGKRATLDGKPLDLPLLQVWNGDFPVASLGRLPEGQRRSPVGFIDDAGTFAAVWQEFMPGEKVPAVDFHSNLAVYVRNVTFYNRTAILKVFLEGGVADILAMETMSALPVEDRVAMSMAVIPRSGVRFIRAGDTLFPVTQKD